MPSVSLQDPEKEEDETWTQAATSPYWVELTLQFSGCDYLPFASACFGGRRGVKGEREEILWGSLKSEASFKEMSFKTAVQIIAKMTL